MRVAGEFDNRKIDRSMLFVQRGQIPGGFGAGAYGSSDIDPFGRNTRGGGSLDSLASSNNQFSLRYEHGSIDVSTVHEVGVIDVGDFEERCVFQAAHGSIPTPRSSTWTVRS